MGAFAAQVSEQVEAIKGGLEAVFKASVQELAEEMIKPIAAGGHMPVDTGYLRSSLMASTAAMPQISGSKPAAGGRFGANDQVSVVIASARPTDTIYLGFTAAYALRQNYGFTGADKLGRMYAQSGHLFVESAAQKWEQIVKKHEAALLSRIAG